MSMNLNLNSIRNRNILNGFGQHSEDVVKAISGDIEKGIEFIKTGKDVTDKIKAKNDKLEIEIKYLTKENEELEKLIGEKPTEDYEHWGEDENNNKITLKQYQMDFDKVCSSNACEKMPMVKTLNGIDNTSNIKKESDINTNKRKFNSNIYKICSLKYSMGVSNVIIRNIKPNQKIKLSEWELRSYGF